MSKQEAIIYETKNLISILHEYLNVLYRDEEIGLMAFERTNESIYSLLYAWQDYFDENLDQKRREILIEPIRMMLKSVSGLYGWEHFFGF